MPSKRINNVDNGPPNNAYAGNPNGTGGIPLANQYLEDGSIPIFWGDNQILNPQTMVYTYPSGMTDNSTLAIPEVVRFIYTYGMNDVPTMTMHAESCDGVSPPVSPPTCGPTAGFLGITFLSYNGNPVYYKCNVPGYTPIYSGSPGFSIWFPDAPSTATVVVYGVQPGSVNLNPPGLVYFVYYSGPPCYYVLNVQTPGSANFGDLATYQLPILITAFCCPQGGSPLPPPPPPSPPSGPGCGNC